MFHCTERLLLRPAWPEDWQAVYAGIADEGVVRNLSRAPWPYQADDARNFVELPVDPMFPRFLITRSRDAALIGCIGLDLHQDSAELGYWIARRHWGQGYATEAGLGVLKVAATLGHRRLVAGHFLDNPASGRVLVKLGFIPTGRVTKRFSCARNQEVTSAEYVYDMVGKAESWASAA
jgi:RimJ/RimL family protein N-acetyltransferase